MCCLPACLHWHPEEDTRHRYDKKEAFCIPFPLRPFYRLSALAQPKTVTIATVNNPDMIELKKLSSKFEADNPDIKLNWVVVEENILRQRVTTDVSTGSGQFDLVFIGLYETPIFAKRGWLQEIKTSLPITTSMTYLNRSVTVCLTTESSMPCRQWREFGADVSEGLDGRKGAENAGPADL